MALGSVTTSRTFIRPPREGEHPLAIADRRQNMVDEQRGPFGHPPAHARRAEAAC